MNICLVVDHNHSYRQAVEAAYYKAKIEGNIDKETEETCLLIINDPEPRSGVVFHESDMEQVFREAEGGGIYFKTLQPWMTYEQAKIRDLRAYADSLANKMDVASEKLKDEIKASGKNPKDLSFLVSGQGGVKAFSPSGRLSVGEIDLFARLANESTMLNSLAMEYVRTLARFVNRTVDGLDAECARYLSRPS